MRIMIASPIRQDPAILTAFLTSLQQLVTRDFTVSYLFIDHNEQKASSELLGNAAASLENAIVISADDSEGYRKDEDTHYWDDRSVWKVAQFKNYFIAEALRQAVDYLFLVDSDLVLHPQTLSHLCSLQKEIISEIFWTQWKEGAMELPQVWLEDEYSMFEKHKQQTAAEQRERMYAFLLQLREKGVYKVGGLGACTLLSAKVLKAGVNFSKLENVSFWGEDRHFCIRAVALGFSLYVDTHYPALHLYRKKDLEKVANVEESKRQSTS
ncbi:hypothetical protein A374_05521 [Fictibacillus macauensis ZFHKF-1]|uniref:Glycosyltransferase n=1 Tax=Fictibacillus macauensis ZFHKF-1 TaxID=1196324 RepID=I8UHU0_9BACL|nr:hypothetical protein [Fictibacillus macauensis]EIT86398.1 hypothetical protein A374_05521 [Fictibacillus macauensis ZFHKF-1]